MPERRPSFARDFPAIPELDSLVDAFARGDYARVRAEAPRLAAAGTDADLARAARTLVERTKPAPLAVLLLIVSAVFVVLLSGYWILHGHPPEGALAPSQKAR